MIPVRLVLRILGSVQDSGEMAGPVRRSHCTLIKPQTAAFSDLAHESARRQVRGFSFP